MTPDANLAVAMQSLVQLIDVEAASKVRTVVEDALHAARQEALEEAAKIARAWIDNQSDIDLSNDPLGRGEGAALEIESAIRERAKQ